MKTFQVKPACNSSYCPHYRNCLEVPTEIYSFNNTTHASIMFVGQTSKDLRNIITERVFPHTGEFNYAWSNIVRFLLPNGRAPTSTELKFCLPYLLIDANRLKIRMFIALGIAPHNALANIQIGSLIQEHGKICTCKIGKQWVSTTYPVHLVAENDISTASDIIKAVQFLDKETQ
jgi:uracil-DNA glycosylase